MRRGPVAPTDGRDRGLPARKAAPIQASARLSGETLRRCDCYGQLVAFARAAPLEGDVFRFKYFLCRGIQSDGHLHDTVKVLRRGDERPLQVAPGQGPARRAQCSASGEAGAFNKSTKNQGLFTGAIVQSYSKWEGVIDGRSRALNHQLRTYLFSPELVRRPGRAVCLRIGQDGLRSIGNQPRTFLEPECAGNDTTSRYQA